MKNFFLFMCAIMLCAAGNAQDFHKAKYFVKYPKVEDVVSGECMVCVTPSPAEGSDVRLIVDNGNQVQTLDLRVKDVSDSKTKTVIVFLGGLSIYTLHDTEKGDVCKITVRGKDDDAFEKIVLIFSL